MRLMNNPGLISVIIPTFNRKSLCKRAVASVLRQTYQNFELIVVDDGSADGTSAEYFFENATHKNLLFIRNEMNRGVSYSRNRGVAHSSGGWIAFLDSDDEWHLQKLKRQVEWVEKNPGYDIMQTREIWIRGGKRVNPPKTHEKQAGYIFEQSLDRCMITPSSVMLKKELFLRYGGFNESIPACEDYGLWLRITLRNPIGLIDEPLLTRYGGREDQLSSSVPVMDKYRIRTLLDLLIQETLDNEQRNLVCRILVKKAEIVANGLKKREKAAEYERYKGIADQYRKCF